MKEDRLNTKRIIGLDWGEKRIGLAISDPSNTFALPKGVIFNDSDFFSNFKEILIKYHISLIVIGLPLMLDGKQTFTSNKVSEFIKKLKKYLKSQNLKILIKTVDESYSTNEAFSLINQTNITRKRKKNIKDAISAQIILNSYLSKNKI